MPLTAHRVTTVEDAMPMPWRLPLFVVALLTIEQVGVDHIQLDAPVPVLRLLAGVQPCAANVEHVDQRQHFRRWSDVERAHSPERRSQKDVLEVELQCVVHYQNRYFLQEKYAHALDAVSPPGGVRRYFCLHRFRQAERWFYPFPLRNRCQDERC